MKKLTRFVPILAVTLATVMATSAQPVMSGAADGGNPSTNGLGPKIQFSTEDYDFGKIISGEPIKYTYTVTNTGDAMLEIGNVKPSCGCTTVGSSSGAGGTAGFGWTRQIAPNQTGVIPIQVATSNLRGPIAKTVTVMSNDKTRPSVILRVHGTVWMPIEVTPQPSAFFTLLPASPYSSNTVLQIFNRMDEPLTLSLPESTTNAFTAQLKTNVPGQEYELIVTASPTTNLPFSSGMSIVQGTISMKTSAPTMPVLSVTAMATVQPEVMVAPPQLSIPGGALTEAITNWVTIRGNTEKPFSLSEPKASVPDVNVSLKVIQPDHNYQLVVVFPKGFEEKAGENVYVSVKSDNPHYLNIGVTVAARPIAPPPRAQAPVRLIGLPPTPTPVMPPPQPQQVVHP